MRDFILWAGLLYFVVVLIGMYSDRKKRENLEREFRVVAGVRAWIPGVGLRGEHDVITDADWRAMGWDPGSARGDYSARRYYDGPCLPPLQSRMPRYAVPENAVLETHTIAGRPVQLLHSSKLPPSGIIGCAHSFNIFNCFHADCRVRIAKMQVDRSRAPMGYRDFMAMPDDA